MSDLLTKLNKFLNENSPVIILNTSTDRALLCLNPVLKIEGDLIHVRFESLNEKGGNSVFVKKLQGFEDKTLYLENEDENILMLQALSLANYNHYIKEQYFNAPDFSDEEELKKYVLTQKSYVW